MADERTSGLHAFVRVSELYKLFQDLLVPREAQHRVRTEFIGDVRNLRILDVGCGPGHWAALLEGYAAYVGIDRNPSHIRAARSQYGGPNVKFERGDVTTDIDANGEPFDMALALGLFHHIADDDAARLAETIAELLAPGGRLLAIEPAYHHGQPWIARQLAANDSGRHVRWHAAYERLLAPHFSEVRSELVTGRLRIPYSQVFLTAVR